MGAETIENTVKGMLRAHGGYAANEAKLMLDRMTRRKDAEGKEFWNSVYVVLCQQNLGKASSVKPEA